MKTALLFLAALAPLLAQTNPTWDTSGNGLLNGTYNFRQVEYISDGTGVINQELAYFGAITFDGNGSYALSGSNTLLNTNGTLGIPASGTYSLASSGFGLLSDPLAAGQSVHILVSKGILIGSTTENPGANGSFNNDLFIAAPATSTFTTASFKGAYTIADFLPGNDATYALNPDGAGNLGTVVEKGYSIGGTSAGTFPNAPYTFSSGVGLMTIGVNVVNNGTPAAYGQVNLYMSPDTNFIFGGAPNGYDFFVGIKNPTASTSLTSGLYYEIGLDEDASQYADDQTANIDTYYGVFNAFSGTIIGHERLLYAGTLAEGVTYTTTYPTGSYTGPANIGQLDPSATVQYTIGAGGIRIGFGLGPWLGIEVAMPGTPPTPAGSVYLDPTGIVNTASSAPFTAGISPGEYITIYNGNTAGTGPCAAAPPFTGNFEGIQVMIDGIAAPIYCVSPQITALVPYEVTKYGNIATIQVINNNVPSNTVTAFVYPTTPGVLTYNPVGGIGFAAAQHAGYTLITPSNPAKPGEEIVVYLSGLGGVFPVNGVPAADGVAVGINGDNVVANIEVDVAGFGSTSVPYAGITPTAAGLYQINFVVPPNAPAGNDPLAIVGPGSWSSEALLPVGPGSGSSAPPATSRRRTLPRLKGTINQ